MSMKVETGVGAGMQESSFMNATLASASESHAISIAVTLPEGAAMAAGVDLDDAEAVYHWLSGIFASALENGCSVNVQVGPEDHA